GEPGLAGAPRISPDGKRVVVSQSSGNLRELYMIELARGISSRFTFNKSPNAYPIWSPDGSRVFFSSNRGGSYNLFQKAADGSSEEEPLLQSDLGKFTSDVSPDGRFLMYSQQSPKTGLDLWILPLSPGATRGRKPAAFIQTPAIEQSGTFSPDGK